MHVAPAPFFSPENTMEPSIFLCNIVVFFMEFNQIDLSPGRIDWLSCLGNVWVATVIFGTVAGYSNFVQV